MLCYVHVPFCRRKCDYCGFHSEPLRPEAMQAYVEGLLREIARHGDRLGRRRLQSIYFGGGTPSLLPANALEAILRALSRAFRPEPHLEITVEVNPESASLAWLSAARRLGVSRVSIGLQALDDAALARLGRLHTARQGLDAYRAARQAGFANVGLDLIWARPGQRLKLWLDELKQVVALAPEHLSCYSLTVEPDTPLEARCLSGELLLPSEDEQGRLFLHGSRYLESEGYLHYEISNFARLGWQSRHNTGYWEGRDYLGLGPSAVSTLGTLRWANPAPLAEWLAVFDQPSAAPPAPPPIALEHLTPAMRLAELAMLRLRTARGLNLRAYRRLAGQSLLQHCRAKIEALSRHDLVRLSHGHLRLTKEGWLLADAIVPHLLPDAWDLPAREAPEGTGAPPPDPRQGG